MDEFHFIRPWWLLALVPLAALVWGLIRHPRGESAWRNICDPVLLDTLLVRSRTHQRAPLLLLILAWLVSTVALAGPTWTRLEQPVFQAQHGRVVVLDLSLSMDATDVSPTRLTRARFKVLDILARSRDGQAGLVVFAHDAYALSPLTDDANTLASLVRVLTTALMPGQGSELAKGMVLADELLFRAGVSAGEVVVVTDGAGNLDAALAVARQLDRRGRAVSVLAVGTAQGAPVPLRSGGFLTDVDGSIVLPGVDLDALRSIASAGGGRFSTLSNDDTDLQRVLDRGGVTLFDDVKQSSVRTDQWREEGIWLVLVLLPFAALGFRRGWLLGCAFLLAAQPGPAHAFEWADLWSRPDQRGAKLLNQEQAAQAAELFENPGWRGAAHYDAGQYERAAQAFMEENSVRGHYNRGNALAKAGDLPGALDAYEQALAMRPDHDDAAFNHGLVDHLLEQLITAGDGTQRPGSESTDERSDQKASNNQRDNQSSDAGLNDDDGRREEEDELLSDQASEGMESGEGSTDSRQNSANRSQPPSRQSSEGGDTQEAQSEEEQQTQGQNSSLGVEQSSALSEETSRSLEQWLRRIPDDPGGLLRQKFLREHRRRQAEYGQQHSETPW